MKLKSIPHKFLQGNFWELAAPSVKYVFSAFLSFLWFLFHHYFLTATHTGGPLFGYLFTFPPLHLPQPLSRIAKSQDRPWKKKVSIPLPPPLTPTCRGKCPASQPVSKGVGG